MLLHRYGRNIFSLVLLYTHPRYVHLFHLYRTFNLICTRCCAPDKALRNLTLFLFSFSIVVLSYHLPLSYYFHSSIPQILYVISKFSRHLIGLRNSKMPRSCCTISFKNTMRNFTVAHRNNYIINCFIPGAVMLKQCNATNNLFDIPDVDFSKDLCNVSPKNCFSHI